MADIQKYTDTIEKISYEVRKVLVGQDLMLQGLMVAVLSRGHVLLEGAPGLAKTLTVNTLAKTLGLSFKRIQFTPDLLPADLIGTQVYNQQTSEFFTSFGPIFASFILADEINRAPAKVQSALLEAMQEKQVTIGKQTYRLQDPFMVMATQNPIEQEGTYQLPEAQLDRFLMKINIDYPSTDDEYTILQRVVVEQFQDVQQVTNLEEVLEMIEFTKTIYIDPKILQYIVAINAASRKMHEDETLSKFAHYIEYGASPRGSIALATISKAKALLAGRDYVTPNDVVQSVHDALRHRLILSYDALSEGITADFLITQIVNKIPQPKVDIKRPE